MEYIFKLPINVPFYGEMLSSGFEMIQENNLLYRNERIYQKLYWHMEFINRELDRKNEQKIKIQIEIFS